MRRFLRFANGFLSVVYVSMYVYLQVFCRCGFAGLPLVVDEIQPVAEVLAELAVGADEGHCITSVGSKSLFPGQ